jgi:hypothetical protein
MVASEGSCMCRRGDEGGELKEDINWRVGWILRAWERGFIGFVGEAFRDGCIFSLVVRFIGIFV